MGLKCWGTAHIIFVLVVGLPMLILWVIGIPLAGFIHLTFNRKHLDSPTFM